MTQYNESVLYCVILCLTVIFNNGWIFDYIIFKWIVFVYSLYIVTVVISFLKYLKEVFCLSSKE